MAAVLTIDGTAINRVTTRTTLLHCRPYAKDGYPELTFARAIGKLAAGPDPWDNRFVFLTQDGTTIFAGDTGSHLTHYDPTLGWIREWTAYGLAKRAEYIPVTDAVTLTDTARYNVPGDDPDGIPSRAGRTVGQIVAEVIEMPANFAALTNAGVGNFVTEGLGAAATASVTGGAVSGVTVTSGGSGFFVAPTVLFSGGGGTGATGTAHVSSGHVTSVSVTAGGSGYLGPPVVILSQLPAVTLADLDTLDIIPPFEVDVAGERILQALEGLVQSCHPNHYLHVDPDGNLRFLDPRTFPADVTLTMDGTGSDARTGRPTITADWSGCYSRCVVRGHDLVVPVTLGVAPWPGSAAADGGLAEDFAHDGLTNAQAKADYLPTDFTRPGLSPGTALAHAVLSGSTVGSVAVDYGGYNYAAAPTVSFSGGAGSGAAATATLTAGKVTSIAVGTAGTGYTSAPTVTLTGPAVGQSDVGTCTCPNTTTVRVTSTNPKANWIADYFDQTDSGHHGVVVLRDDTLTGITQVFTARVVANTALTAGGTSDLTLDVPLPSTGYTSYQLFGTSGGASLVYRRYKVTNPSIAASLANYFPYPVAYRNSDGSAATLTSTPAGTVFYSPDGNPPYRQSGIGVAVDPVAGTVTTAKPTALVFSADGTTLVPVDDFQAFLPVHTGALAATWPADIAGAAQYTGTAHSSLALQRTKTITVPDWRDGSNAANMLRMAQEYLDTVKDVVIEGSVPYHGLQAAALTTGHALNIAGNGYTTGWESLAAPIVAVDLEYQERGGATHFVTTLHFSNRRAPFSGATLRRPSMVGQPLGSGGGEAGSLEQTFGQLGEALGLQSQFGGVSESTALAATAAQFGAQAADTSGIPTGPLQAPAQAGAGPTGGFGGGEGE